MIEKSYSEDDAFAAMCLWEEIVNPTLSSAPRPWDRLRELVGTNELRFMVLHLAPACEAAWVCASRSFHKRLEEWSQQVLLHAAGGPPPDSYGVDDPGSFDWEFVPFWIRNCVDWSGDAPRVKGSGHG